MSYYGRCETCGMDLFEQDVPRLLAYRRRSANTLESVDLKGRAPCSGVKLMCASCLRFFCSIVVDRFQSGETYVTSKSS